MSRTADLQIRLHNIIVGTCNTVGCVGCDLKWTDENGVATCQATELQAQIDDIEMNEDNE